jgi:hypothetical protein
MAEPLIAGNPPQLQGGPVFNPPNGDRPMANPLYQMPERPPTPAEQIRQMTRSAEPDPRPIWDTLGQPTRVSDRELTQIRNIVGGLDRPAANQTIGNLSNSELREIGTAMNREASRGSMTQPERDNFVRDLAGKLDEKQFSRVMTAFQRPPQEMANILASTHGNTNDAKIAFLNAHGKNAPAVATVLASMQSNPDGMRRAVTITGADGKVIRQGALSPEELRSAVAMSAMPGRQPVISTPEIGPGGEISTRTLDNKQYRAIMNAAAASGDADVKAEVFRAGVERLTQLQQATNPLNPLGALNRTHQRYLTEMTDSLDKILQSDTPGVVRSLRTREPLGESLTAFTTQRLNEGNVASLSRMTEQLRFGPGSPVGRPSAGYLNIPRTGSDVVISRAEERAHDFGYGLGAIMGASDRAKKTAAEKADLAGKLVSLVAMRAAGSTSPYVNEAGVGGELGTKGILSANQNTPLATYMGLITSLPSNSEGAALNYFNTVRGNVK